MNANNSIVLNFNNATPVKTGLVFKAGDKGITFHFSVRELDPTGMTPHIAFYRSNATSVESEEITETDGVFTYTTMGNEFAVPGVVVADLKFYDENDTQRVSTASFIFNVSSDTLDGFSGETGSYSDALERVMEELEEAEQDLKDKQTEFDEAIDSYVDAFGNLTPLNPRGIYNSTATYNPADTVYYGNTSWICRQTCTGETPAAGDYWQQMVAPSAAMTLGDLTDVDTTGASNGKVLTYRSGEWNPESLPEPPTVPTDLDDLDDVSISSPTNGQAIVYNNTSNKWENQALPSGVTTLAALNDVDTTGATNGQVLTFDSANSEWVADSIPTPTVPEDLNDLSDVAVTSPANGQAMVYDGTASKWTNQALPSGVTTLAALNDVDVTGVTNGQLLGYNSSSSEWEAVNAPTAVGDLDDLTDVTITTPTNGQILAYNSSSSKWENADNTAGGILPHVIVNATADTVALTKGATTISATETSTDVWEADVTGYGTWTATATQSGQTGTATIDVDAVKIYTTSIGFFTATITVSYPSAATCTLSASGQSTQTATGSPYTFTVHEAATYTVTATISGTSRTKTVVITTDGQTETETFLVNGSTVTPTDSVATWLDCAYAWDKNYTTLAQVIADSQTLLKLISTNNAVDYMVRSTTFATGTNLWDGTIALSNSYLNDNGSVTSNANNLNVTDYIEVNPGTVVRLSHTNADEAQSPAVCWYDSSKTYIGGKKWGGAMSMDISLPNNAHYIRASVRSAWVDNFSVKYGIVDDPLAMLYIGEYNYCADTLLANSTWNSAIVNNDYFELVLNNKVPVMTGNTVPSGECFASSTASEKQPYYAFDGDLSTGWTAASSTNQSIGYTFASPTAVNKVHFAVQSDSSTTQYIKATTYTVQASNDGTNWSNLATYSGSAGVMAWDTTFLNATKYTSYRVLVAGENWNVGTSYIIAREVQFYGRSDVVAPSHTLKTFAAATDKEIAEMVLRADRGEIDLYDDAGWRVGQEHSVSIAAIPASGTNYTVGEAQSAQIATFVLMHQGLYEPVDSVLNKQGQTRTTCSFVTGIKDGLTTKGYMNSTNSNSGSWDGSARRAWCNEGFKQAISAPMRVAFKRFKTTTAQTYNGATNKISNDYFALFAAKEIIGGTATSVGAGSGYSNLTEFNALTQMTYYETSANRVKKVNGTNSAWFERSPNGGSAEGFAGIGANGSATADYASTTFGIAPFGCL